MLVYAMGVIFMFCFDSKSILGCIVFLKKKSSKNLLLNVDTCTTVNHKDLFDNNQKKFVFVWIGSSGDSKT